MQGKWGGQGGTAFFNLHEAWNEKQQIIVNALDEFEASLQQTEKDNVTHRRHAVRVNYTNAQRPPRLTAGPHETRRQT